MTDSLAPAELTSPETSDGFPASPIHYVVLVRLGSTSSTALLERQEREAEGIFDRLVDKLGL